VHSGSGRKLAAAQQCGPNSLRTPKASLNLMADCGAGPPARITSLRATPES